MTERCGMSERDDSEVPGVVLAHSPGESEKYIGSPSIIVLEDGTYHGLDDEELAALVADDDVEVIEHTSPGEEEAPRAGMVPKDDKNMTKYDKM